jgi:hypothetical protein
MTTKAHDHLNCNVFVALSQLPDAGNGLFAKQFICKNDIICTYGGRLINEVDAKFENPTYIVDFEMGHGFKLLGDNLMGDMGIYVNGLHPLKAIPERKNARFNLNKSKKTLPNMRGMFKLVATRDIQIGDEIILDYGPAYWRTIAKWDANPCPVKSKTVTDREYRVANRGGLL